MDPFYIVAGTGLLILLAGLLYAIYRGWKEDRDERDT